MWDSKQVVNQWYPKKQHWWLAVPTTESHTARCHYLLISSSRLTRTLGQVASQGNATMVPGGLAA
jgi:hypothetical protein